MIRQGAVTRDGRGEAVVGIVMMLMGENARAVVDRVKEKIAEIWRDAAPRGHDRHLLRPHRAGPTDDPHGGQEPARRRRSWSSLVLLLLLGNLRGGLIVALGDPAVDARGLHGHEAPRGCRAT
jgi:cobalt-zinc-cadmium resistance protein CzcA